MFEQDFHGRKGRDFWQLPCVILKMWMKSICLASIQGRDTSSSRPPDWLWRESGSFLVLLNPKQVTSREVVIFTIHAGAFVSSFYGFAF